MQEGTDNEDYVQASAATADGNVVLAGSTLGSWNGTQVGNSDAAVTKLNAEDGTVMWRYMVRMPRTAK